MFHSKDKDSPMCTGDADREQTYGQGWGEEGEGEMNGESSMEAYTLSYMKHTDNGNWLFDSEDSTWGSVRT